ncbi:MAG: hypothetical protein IPQ02_01975 [Saprospiraceae bacterium]|uniref:Uncharacterized protein n=1 Tax=Candidatus Defluviibacterium haderslevense TaxID=2981993 RepID=A0A9D7XF69_9BACT|nr:hypothetical protein [Candidatus Defluviibacterium haderslevense]MBL0235405.1 hypothetical protein [Candidatus Defluviibacterium haderslevense]
MKKSELYVMVFNILAIVSFSGCFDPEDCPDRFHVPAEIIPYEREYHIGDTIKFISKFERHVHELQTDRKYDMNNMVWNPNGGIWFLDTIGYSKVSDHFQLILPANYHEYNSSEGYSVLEGQYEFRKDTYLLEFIIIPKRIGNYYFEHSCGIGPNHGDVDFPGKCKRKGYDVIVDMNSGKDGNIDILKLAKDSLYNTWVLGDPKRNFYDRGGFCFRVIP